MSEKHTPTPWRTGSPDYRCIEQHNGNLHPGRPLCEYTFQGWDEGEYFDRHVSSESAKSVIVGSDDNGPMLSQADADLIVLAVNAHADLLAALESAPEPPVDYVDVQDILAHPATVREIFKTWREWHDGVRAAVLAKVKA